MNENQQEELAPENKESKMQKIKENLHPRKLILSPLKFLLGLVKKIMIKLLFNPITGIILGFIIGARMHETGYLAGHLKKDLKNATIFVSGKCSVNGKERIPSLLEDQIKVTSFDGESLQGVVRKTRELVDCKYSEISTDSLPLLKDMFKSPENRPSLEAPIAIAEEVPAYKKLEKQRLLVSGSCVTLDEQPIPTFTDEKVDVTEIKPQTENKKEFILSGIKRSDKIAIKCLSNAISYKIDDKKEEAPPVAVTPEAPKTYIGETMLISGVCYPDERVNKAVNGKKLAFFRLANSKVQVIDSKLDDQSGKVIKLWGTVLEDEFKGQTAICEQKKFPFFYRQYNPDEQQLEKSSISSDVPAPKKAVVAELPKKEEKKEVVTEPIKE